MAKKTSRRDYYRREHRTIAHYLMILCWMEGSDQIELETNDLKEILGVEVIRSERLDWLEEDLQPWFQVERYRCEEAESTSRSAAGRSSRRGAQGLRLTQPSPLSLNPGERLKPITRTRAADSEARIQHLLSMASGLGTPKRRSVIAR